MLAFTALGAAAHESCLCSWPLAGIKSSAKQSKAKQSKAKQIKAKQSKAMQSKAKQIHAKQSKAGLGGGSPATRGVWGAGVPPGSETQFLCGQRLGTFVICTDVFAVWRCPRHPSSRVLNASGQ